MAEEVHKASRIKDRYKLNIIAAITSFAFLSQILISKNVWYGKMEFPRLPVFEFMSFCSDGIIHIIISVIFLIGLIYYAVRSSDHRVAWMLTIVLGIMFISDVNRVQAWSYQYYLMLLALCTITYPKSGKREIRHVLRFIIIAIYFWGSIHKINLSFLEDNTTWLLSAFINFDSLQLSYGVGILMILTELSIALCLLFKKTTKIGIVLVFIFHVLILLIIGPFGHNWNEVVWPWNLLMPALVFLLFTDTGKERMQSNITVQLIPGNWMHRIVVILLVLPIFNFFEAWDDHLSFTMYAGVGVDAVFYSRDPGDCIPEEVGDEAFKDRSGTTYIALDDWTFLEMKIPVYNSGRFIKRAGTKLCDCLSDYSESGIEVLESKSRWEKETIIQRFTCKDLLNGE